MYENKLREFPKVNLGFFPTPLHRLDRISQELEVNIFIKREDLSGPNVFGGNKIRKLEYLLGEAKAEGYSTVLTFGATQSNHAMQTVTACRKIGLEVILVLASIIESDENDMRSNFLIDHLMDAEVHVIDGNNKSIEELNQMLLKKGDELVEACSENNKKCYVIPTGGNNTIGSLGFVSGYVEILEQTKNIGVKVDYICHATGTGGTLAGLSAAKKLTDVDTKVISFSVAEMNDEYANNVVSRSNEILELFGLGNEVTIDDLNIDENYYMPGYEIPNVLGNEAIKYLASKEGILLDPVYSGKGFAGLIDYIKKGKIPKGSNVVFIHTGGATALFAEKEIVGELSSQKIKCEDFK